MKLRVCKIESMAFGFGGYVIQEKKWWGWHTINRSYDKSCINNLAKHYEEKGHTVIW